MGNKRQLTDAEIVILINKIINAEGSEEEIDHWLYHDLSELSDLSDLIFHSQENLSAEEILERCRQNKPICL